MLKTTVSGAETSPLPPVVLAHGLFGSGRNLGGIARALSDRKVISVDMRNHGDSFHSNDHSYHAMAGDLEQVIAAAGGTADVVGHSMGGKAAMMLALTHPERVRRLVVLDIAPVAYTHSQEGLIAAMTALDLSQITRRSEADAALAPRIPDAGVRAFLLQSLDFKTSPPQWRLNLDTLDRAMDDITGWPAPKGPAQTVFSGPALFLYGDASSYCAGKERAEILRYFPQATLHPIKGAGHWLHAERPDEVNDAISVFLAD